MAVETDPAERLFKEWATLSQQPTTADKVLDHLQAQNHILESLLTSLHSRSYIPSHLSLGLLRGALASDLGTRQPSREFRETDETTKRAFDRIRDTLLIVALQALCLRRVVANAGDEEEEADDDESKTILASRDDLSSLNMTMLDVSAYLSEDKPSYRESLPIPILCLAWAAVIYSTPSHLKLQTPGIEDIVALFVERALGSKGFFFPWLEEVLRGAAVTERVGEDAEKGFVLEYRIRKTLKDVVTALVDMLRVEAIGDRAGFDRVWELLYTGGSARVSAELCEDYWIGDANVNTRNATLYRSSFPRNMSILPILSVLSGKGSSGPYPQAGFNVAPAQAVFETFGNLPNFVLPLASIGEFETIGADDERRTMISTNSDIVLPGGGLIASDTQGTIDEDQDGVRRVTLNSPVNGWSLLFDIMRDALGLRTTRPAPTSSSDSSVYLSVADLGIQSGSIEILSGGLDLFRSILHPSFGLSTRFFEILPTQAEIPSIAVLEVVLSVLSYMRESEMPPTEFALTATALDLLGYLLVLPGKEVWSYIRSSSFFGPYGKSKSIAAALIQADSKRDTHEVSLAIVRLVHSITAASANTAPPDFGVVKSAVQLIVSSVFSAASMWRFADPVPRFELFSYILSSILHILDHPYAKGKLGNTEPAEYLVGAFITSGAMNVYRPMVEILAQGTATAIKLNELDRPADASIVLESLDRALDTMTILLRLSTSLNLPPNSLPTAIFPTPIHAALVDEEKDKITLVEHLVRLATFSKSPATTTIRALGVLRAFLITITFGSQILSLASLLHDVRKICQSFETMTVDGATDEVKSLTWSVVATIVSTQPGSASACVGDSGAEIKGLLAKAVEKVHEWEELIDARPRVLASVLQYLVSVLSSSTSSTAVKNLRSHPTFWTTVFYISRRIVPTPPTFTLSMHHQDFASRIQAYAYAVQAKANATSLLAIELGLSAEEEEQGNSQARELVVGLFKNGTEVTEATLAAVHNSCYPDLHERHRKTLIEAGVDLEVVKTVASLEERDFGSTYLYDGQPNFPSDAITQSAVNLALDMLNLSWSMVDADIALTRSFRAMAQATLTHTEDDTMTAVPALRSASNLVELIADEDRQGDIILSIQAERLEILVVLLEMACSDAASIEEDRLVEIWRNIRRVLETGNFSSSLRHAHLPPLHKPMLRILSLLLESLPRTESPIFELDSAIEAATVFALDAADFVLEGLVHQPNAPLPLSADLASIVSVLCEVTRTPNSQIWLDKVAEHNLVSRSLEVITRAQITEGQITPQVASVLLLHLALASNEAFAERLAVAGILPAYSHNAIMFEAENGQIDSSDPSPSITSVHGAWCGMIMVVKALLSTLPLAHASNFAKSDVLPFISVSWPQIDRTLSWKAQTPLSQPALNELELITDLFGCVAQATGPSDSLLDDISLPFLQLLKTARYALSHPHILSTLLVPSSEDEKNALEQELKKLDEMDNPQLLDFTGLPIVAERTTRILGVTRNVSLALVTLTKAWSVLISDIDDYCDGELLEVSDEDLNSTSDDPVSIVNDLFTAVNNALAHLSPASRDADVQAARTTLTQLAETLAVLSASQIMYRRSLIPHEAIRNDDSMDIDGGMKRRGSSDIGSASKSVKVLRDLAVDLRTALPGDDEGDRFLVKLRRLLERGMYIDDE